ncbi:unnamed protein product [Bursaphelenchus okinawaensis]|uniref:Uncharacterized protein n=1 Tax=Bursaphelenchus okinawaensis TaxID=465554 RepID=A0A811KBJ6_9BILA|nr:unnamed protein product [Bursaphelenchus okinawaensis]CAG9099322.1 unnamed protein product [Bursaphelenchus okinawaensis]
MYLNVGIQIYDIKTRTYVYVLNSSDVVCDDYEVKGIDGIHFHRDSKFIGYNKKKNNWEEMGKWPYENRLLAQFINLRFLTLATIDRVEEKGAVTLTHFDWSSGHLTWKKFQPINSNAMGFDYLILSDIEIIESPITEWSINDVRSQYETIINLLTNYSRVSALQF